MSYGIIQQSQQENEQHKLYYYSYHWQLLRYGNSGKPCGLSIWRWGCNQSSWHYTVDSKEIWQSFEDNSQCWHAGDGVGLGNSSSIAIEICVNDKASFKQACQNASWLVSELLKKHNLGIDRVVQHNKWSGKNCPPELQSGAWEITWDEFIGMVKQKLNLSDILAKGEASEWASEAWTWATKIGLTDGTKPKENCTREQLVTILHRFASIVTK